MSISVALEHRTSYTFEARLARLATESVFGGVEAGARRARRFEATGFTPGKFDVSAVREKQARISTDIGAPGILDLRRVRTVQR